MWKQWKKFWLNNNILAITMLIVFSIATLINVLIP